MSIFVAASPGTRTPAGSMQTTSANALKASATPTPCVGSVKVNVLSYRYRADKSTIFGMRGLWGLTINSGKGATLKYLKDGRKSKKKKKWPPF